MATWQGSKQGSKRVLVSFLDRVDAVVRGRDSLAIVRVGLRDAVLWGDVGRDGVVWPLPSEVLGAALQLVQVYADAELFRCA